MNKKEIKQELGYGGEVVDLTIERTAKAIFKELDELIYAKYGSDQNRQREYEKLKSRWI